jgi:transmembrane sensor
MRPEDFYFGATPSDDARGAEAALWLSRQDRGMTTAETEAFRRWMAAPPHAAEFRRLERTWHDLDQIKADSGLVEMSRQLDRKTRSRRFGSLGVVAFAAAALVLVGFWVRSRAPGAPPADAAAGPLAYRVVPSAARLLKLPDGSSVALRDDSEVSTDFTPATRRLRLVRGEAHFKVTKNPARPFIVSVGGVAVRAVGTAFDIQFDRDQVEVIVTEGRVTVEDLSGAKPPPLVPQLAAGQRAIISSGTIPGRPRVVVDSPAAAQLDQILAWQSTWLVFDRTRLDQAVEAFNRHSSQRIILGDAALADRRLGGMFRADNVDGFVRLLGEGVDVRSERRGDNEIVLLPARP